MLVLVMLVLVQPELRTFVWLPSISGWSFCLQPLILVKFSHPLVLFLCGFAGPSRFARRSQGCCQGSKGRLRWGWGHGCWLVTKPVYFLWATDRTVDGDPYIELLKFIWLWQVLIGMSMLKSQIIIIGQDVAIRSKNFWWWIMMLNVFMATT